MEEEEEEEREKEVEIEKKMGKKREEGWKRDNGAKGGGN